MKRIVISFLRRVLGALMGFLSAGVVCFLIIVAAMVFCRSTFGVSNIGGAVLAAAVLGALAGFFIPRVTRRLIDPWFSIFGEI
ncbi:MAG TPA: hypothetical protein VKH64_09390 [Candidatus Binatia bacterium]|nr:hypothetical protein [Candidatus Binatia bacterium]